MFWLFVYGSKYIFALADIVKDRLERSDLLQKVDIYWTSFRIYLLKWTSWTWGWNYSRLGNVYFFLGLFQRVQSFNITLMFCSERFRWILWMANMEDCTKIRRRTWKQRVRKTSQLECIEVSHISCQTLKYLHISKNIGIIRISVCPCVLKDIKGFLN